jgi:cytochrome c
MDIFCFAEKQAAFIPDRFTHVNLMYQQKRVDCSHQIFSTIKEAVVKTRYLVAMMAALSVSATAFAAGDDEALFNSKKCNSCHKLDTKAVGPTLKAISAKYAEDKGAQAKLEAKVRAGGAGVWGTIPMPRIPAATASDEEVKVIVAWMLSRK